MTTSLDQKKDLLCQAITDKHLVQFKYDGRSRIVEPFCCGISTAGNYVLRGFQIRGSDTGEAALLETVRTLGNFIYARYSAQLQRKSSRLIMFALLADMFRKIL